MHLIEDDNSVTFSVRVIPRSSRAEIVGEHDGALKIKLTSPPVDGAANAELIKVLAKALGTSKSSIRIVSGETSKTKLIRIDGVTAKQVNHLLGS